MTTTVLGRLPSLNEYLHSCKGGKHSGNQFKRENQEICKKYIAYNSIGKKQFTKPVDIIYHFYEPNRKRDKSNVSAFFIKVFEDALQEMAIIQNDNWKGVNSFECFFSIDAENPRVVVDINEHISL